MSALEWALGIFALVAVVLDARNRPPSPGDADQASAKQRTEAMKKRQETARELMEQKGIKSLLNGRAGWRKVVVMSDPPKAAKVTPIRRRAT